MRTQSLAAGWDTSASSHQRSAGTKVSIEAGKRRKRKHVNASTPKTNEAYECFEKLMHPTRVLSNDITSRLLQSGSSTRALDEVRQVEHATALESSSETP